MKNNAYELYKRYQNDKRFLKEYIHGIKQKSHWDIYTIINPTLIANPFASNFPKIFFIDDWKKNSLIMTFLKNIVLFYLKSVYFLSSYFVAFLLYKIYYTKKNLEKPITIIDTFALIDKINSEENFNDNYLTGIYELFDTYHQPYTILPRLVGAGKNPFKLILFFKILSREKKSFLLEFELLRIRDFISLFGICAAYPFHTLRLLQEEQSVVNRKFNQALLEDIRFADFDTFARYITGRNISNLTSVKQIYSWSEFQAIERSFNFGVRKHNKTIKIIGCQLFLNYETYFNTAVEDIDFDMMSSPHEVLVNGPYYIQARKKIYYKAGISLRYKNLFSFAGVQDAKHILILGSYSIADTKYMIEQTQFMDNVIFKNHPAVDINRLGELPARFIISYTNIYELFTTTKLVISTASGTCVEAVACGISVIVMASQDNLTANPLVGYGQGKIWDIVYDSSEIAKVFTQLMQYRMNHLQEINEIAHWYKKNFFTPLTEDNIQSTFGFNE